MERTTLLRCFTVPQLMVVVLEFCAVWEEQHKYRYNNKQCLYSTCKDEYRVRAFYLRGVWIGISGLPGRRVIKIDLNTIVVPSVVRDRWVSLLTCAANLPVLYRDEVSMRACRATKRIFGGIIPTVFLHCERIVIDFIISTSQSHCQTMFRYLLFMTLFVQAIYGFAPNAHKQRAVDFRPANFVSAAAPTSATIPLVFLRMATGSDGEESRAVESKISADGTFYDDEVRNSLLE